VPGKTRPGEGDFGAVWSYLGLTGNLRRGPKSAVSKKTGGKMKADGVHVKRRPGNREQMVAGSRTRSTG
jgi:hypothetical protein